LQAKISEILEKRQRYSCSDGHGSHRCISATVRSRSSAEVLACAHIRVHFVQRPSIVHMPFDAMPPGNTPLLINAQVHHLFRTGKSPTRYQIMSVAILHCLRACIDFHASPDVEFLVRAASGASIFSFRDLSLFGYSWTLIRLFSTFLGAPETLRPAPGPSLGMLYSSVYPKPPFLRAHRLFHTYPALILNI
jgi:hypothetical protein